MTRAITLMTPENGVVRKPNDLTFQWNIAVKPVLTVNVVKVGADYIKINWQPDPYAKEHKIYQDGALIVTLTNTIANYMFTNLSSNTRYTFGVSAVDFLGQESEVVNVIAETNFDDILIIDEIPSSLAIVSMPTKTVYHLGEVMDLTGLVVEMVYDGPPERRTVVPNDYLDVQCDTRNVGTQIVTVGLNYFIGYFPATFEITVEPSVVEAINIETMPLIVNYQVGDVFSYAGLVVRATYDDATTGILNNTFLTFTGFDSSVPAAEQQITVAYGEVFTAFTIAIGGEGFAYTSDGYFEFDHLTKKIMGFVPDGGIGEVLTEIVIPSSFNVEGTDYSVEQIGDGVFSGKNLTRVVLPSSLLVIEDNAFAGNNLVSVVIPTNVTTIGVGAFWNNHLTSIILPNSVVSVGASAFGRNSDLETVTLSESMDKIATYTFMEGKITSVVIPESVRYVESGAFINCPVTAITIGGDVQFELYPAESQWLGAYGGFANVYNAEGRSAGTYEYDEGSQTWSKVGLTDIVVTVVKSTYFVGDIFDDVSNTCISIVAIYANGDEKVIQTSEAVISGFDSASIDDAQILTVSYKGIEKEIQISIVAKQATPAEFFTWDHSTGRIMGYNIAGGLDVVIPDMIEDKAVGGIGEDAFKDLGITSIILPDTITSIGGEAFSGNKLRALRLPVALTFIGASAFKDNQISGEVILPDTVETLGISAFENNKINSVALSNGLSWKIANQVFYKNLLTSLILPSTISEIGDYSFGENDIVRIEIGALMSFNVYNHALGKYSTRFIELYKETGSKAGVYEYSNDAWIKIA